jgi:hypothetical protein
VAALYISLMHYRTKYFLWTSVFISFSFILAMAIFIQDYRSKYFPGCNSEDNSTPECTQPATIGNLLQFFSIFLYIMAFVYGIMVICLFKDQDLSITIFRVTTKVIAKNIRMLGVPTLMGSIIVGYILYWFYTFGMLYTTPDIIPPTNY